MRVSRILIADDDAAFVAALAERLENEGYGVATSQTGYEALMLALSHEPDLLILDINMPMGNGFSIHERMRKFKAYATKPVIFVSGEPVEWLERAALEHGAYAFLRKPIDDTKLVLAVRNALDEAAGSAA